MDSELVTVVIPTYNRAILLGETIKSVLAQTYENIELLILDDCSTDNTTEIVKSFNDKRLKYLRHECNIGFVANWTYGVNMAKGRYLSILGDDDKYEPTFIAKRVDAFKNHENIIAATGAFTCCDAAGKFERASKIPFEENRVLEGIDLLKFTLGFTGEWFNGATLYNIDVVRSLWNKALTAGTALDFSLHIRISLLPEAQIIFNPESDMYLRVHPNQESRQNNLYLAECAANLAVQMWNLEIRHRNKDIIVLFRNKFATDLNHYGRILWDRGTIRESRNVFKSELAIDSIRPITWLRLLRTYLNHLIHFLM